MGGSESFDRSALNREVVYYQTCQHIDYKWYLNFEGIDGFIYKQNNNCYLYRKLRFSNIIGK